MKILLSLAAAGLVLSAGSVHPQPLIEIHPPVVLGIAPPPPPEDLPPPRRMVCLIDTPFPNHQRSCDTHPGYPGSPCRCAGSFFEGERVVVD